MIIRLTHALPTNFSHSQSNSAAHEIGAPRLVRTWADLAQVPDSDTHRLDIDVEKCNGWINRKDGNEFIGHYLSTHTFYGSQHAASTKLLQSCGFNVVLENWDA